ncbi:zf-HC2 domain-containing protein [Candidatus Magnetaquicoccus inordinatus]|uniref:zf-HC2 domain-containing protein n=1 Tax=Candidatus Magnetaquicoccus inordinatus TaxID=2496818 RepID=UPI00102B120E|nr:zf-HC2 domain-containing protein [Candidatus Magnetaquicoccus inordinatus]
MKPLSIQNSAPREQAAEHLTVLLSLAAGQEKRTESCPSARELSDLLEGALSVRQREALLQHLDRCAVCYQSWLGGAALQGGQHSENIVNLALWRRKKMWGFLALAAGLVLVWVQWNPLAPDMGNMVTAAYRNTLADGRLLDKERLASLLPGGSAQMALGFADNRAENLLRQAYLSGVKAGWERLQTGAEGGAGDASTHSVEYYQLGRWVALLQGSCQLDPPPQAALLRQQAPISSALAERLRKRAAAGEVEARIAAQEVETIRQWLTLPGAAEDSAARLCRELQKACLSIHEGFQL